MRGGSVPRLEREREFKRVFSGVPSAWRRRRDYLVQSSYAYEQPLTPITPSYSVLEDQAAGCVYVYLSRLLSNTIRSGDAAPQVTQELRA